MGQQRADAWELQISMRSRELTPLSFVVRARVVAREVAPRKVALLAGGKLLSDITCG